VRINLKGECLLIYLGRDDLISSLKRFKSYAKQELLAAGLTSNPEVTRAIAQARKDEYENLIQIIMDKGVSSAYEEATTAYKELKARLSIYDRDAIKRHATEDLSIANDLGREQALENFLSILGSNEVENAAGRGVS